MTNKEKITVVFISGFLTPNDWISYPHDLIPDNIEMINVFPSSTGSLHDRVCEIFYELVGGRIDYGEEHAQFHGHARYGRSFEKGLLPKWSKDNPIMLVGHSFGGVSGWVLQNYLAERRFPGYDTDASWVTSVIGVNSPYNGTIKVYDVGQSMQPPLVDWCSGGYWISFAVHVGECFNIRKYMDLDQRQWMVWLGSPQSILLCILMICGYGMHSATDNVAYDTTIHSMYEWNKALNVFPDTFYFSIVGKVDQEILHEEDLRLNKKPESWFFEAMRAIMRCRKVYPPKEIAGIPTQDWYDSGTDGVVCSYTQEYPKIVPGHVAEHVHRLKDNETIQPGVWYYTHRNISHLCASFTCEKTWTYILHTIEEMHSRHLQLKETIAKETDQQRKVREAKYRAHSISQQRPDMQVPSIDIDIVHANEKLVEPARKTFARLVLILISLMGLLYEASTFSSTNTSLTHSQAIAYACIPLLLCVYVGLCRNLSNVSRIYMAQLHEVSFGLCKWVLYDVLLHGNATVQSWVGGESGIEKVLLWVVLVEGVVNAGFFQQWSGALCPGLKLWLGWMSVRMMSRNLGGDEQRLAEYGGVGMAVSSVLPSLLWMLVNGVDLEKHGAKYSIRVGYVLGGLFVFLGAMMVMSLSPCLAMEGVWEGSTRGGSEGWWGWLQRGLRGEAEEVGWLLGVLYLLYVKWGDFAYFLNFVLIKMRFLYYRFQEIKRSEHVE